MNYLWLEECGIQKLDCRGLREETKGEIVKLSLSVTQRPDFSMRKEGHFSQVLNVKVIPEPAGPQCGYSLDVEIWGRFRLPDPQVDIDKNLDKLVLNGAMILYGILRGNLMSITACCVGPRLLLPSVDLTRILGENHEVIAKDKKAKQRRTVRKKKTSAS